MTEQPRHNVSEFTEKTAMAGAEPLANFAASLGWGSLVGTVALLLPFAGSATEEPIATLLGSLLFFGFYIGLFTMAGMVVIGIPVTILLKVLGAEYRLLYAFLGALAGLTMLFGLLGFEFHDDIEAVNLLAAGTLAGFAAALRWGRWRETRMRSRRAPMPGGKRSNRVHDLFH